MLASVDEQRGRVASILGQHMLGYGCMASRDDQR